MSDTMESGIQKQTAQDIAPAFVRADHIVMRTYLKQLDLLPIKPLETTYIPTMELKDGAWIKGQRPMRASDCSMFFNVGKLVYDREENNLQKLTNIYAAAAAIGINICLVIYSNGTKAEMYLGVCGEMDGNKVQPKAEALYNSLIGNFPGSLAGSETPKRDNDKVDALMNLCFGNRNTAVASVSGVASARNTETDKNEAFVQGIEKLFDSMRGEPFTAILIADCIGPAQLEDIKAEYELLYSKLSPFAKSTLTVNESRSEGTTKTLSDSLADTVSENTSTALSIGSSKSKTHTEGKTIGHTDTAGINFGGSISAGVNLGIVSGGTSTYAGGHYSHSYNRSKSFSDATTFGTSKTSTDTQGKGTARTVTKTTSDGTTETYTSGNALQITYENKSVTNLLQKIDAQLERIKASESFGVFATAAYFIAESRPLAQRAASAYRSIISGKNTSLETTAINCWDKGGDSEEKFEDICDYLRMLRHPEFYLTQETGDIVTPASIVSAQELALQIGLPKKSVSGVSVIETASFGRNILTARGGYSPVNGVKLGTLYHMGQAEPNSPVTLDAKSLTMHTFVTGSTGAGKSNTIYTILNNLPKDTRFLIIEPAKGEYKEVFGGRRNVSVYGTNFNKAPLLRLNPFSFPDDIHVLEHIDRLVEIFNACWPMYAAMPAVLKDAIESSYVSCGWNLTRSTCYKKQYPTFATLLQKLPEILNSSAYSADTKGDYTGALVTRVKSLTNGINGQIFCADEEIPDQKLFDENVIVDLSRVGSMETKSLLMGILMIRLQEYRMSSAQGTNAGLKHLTVLEEAHNLLRRTSAEQSQEGANLQGKSVEMLANAIAEMRTYGEGFIIADQAPGLLDMAVIRNTNTKIIMRLPDESDRMLVGKAAGLNDDQIVELSKLDTGVAAVYQNHWLEPVLCQVDHFPDSKCVPLSYIPQSQLASKEKSALLQAIVDGSPEKLNLSQEDVDTLNRWVSHLNIGKFVKERLLDIINNRKTASEVPDRDYLVYCLIKGSSMVEKVKSYAEIDALDAEISDMLNVEATLAVEIRNLAINYAMGHVKPDSDLYRRLEHCKGGIM